jgi:hypothetical protein
MRDRDDMVGLLQQPASLDAEVKSALGLATCPQPELVLLLSSFTNSCAP